MKAVKKLVGYLADYKQSIFLYFLCSTLAIIFGIFSFSMLTPILQVLFMEGKPVLKVGNDLATLFTNEIYKLMLVNTPLTVLTYAIITVVFFTILKNLFIYLSSYILNPLRNAILRQLRDELFSKTLALPIGFFTEEKKGDLMSRMTNDINEVENSIVSVLEAFIREPLTIIVTLAIMLSISLKLTLFLLLFLPITGIVIGRIGKSLKRPSNLAQEQLGKILGVLDETLSGMRVVKAFNAEKGQHLKFAKLNNTLFRTRNNIAARRESASPISETMGIIIICCILWYGGRLIFDHNTSLTGPIFMTYIGLFYNIINPLKNLSSAVNNVQKGSAALDRIEHILQADISIKEIENPVPIKDFEHQIEFKNVSFSYQDKAILSDINLRIPKGKTIALVGASGAGKSTLVDLIPRFHDATSGAILIDGINIKDLSIEEMRRLMGIVSQEPILFNDTIFNNICLGTGGATIETVTNAAKVANAYNFITSKAEQFETNVGDRGVKLSGGEKQRITIARAVLKNPPILILDEATSSLDTESEKMVQEAINVLMKNRTCIVIAHRLSTVQFADEIIVLDKGKIVERGSHTELIELKGYYQKLVTMQQVK